MFSPFPSMSESTVLGSRNGRLRRYATSIPGGQVTVPSGKAWRVLSVYFRAGNNIVGPTIDEVGVAAQAGGADHHICSRGLLLSLGTTLSFYRNALNTGGTSGGTVTASGFTNAASGWVDAGNPDRDFICVLGPGTSITNMPLTGNGSLTPSIAVLVEEFDV